MKKITLSLVLVFSYLIINAQNYSITWDKNEKKNKIGSYYAHADNAVSGYQTFFMDTIEYENENYYHIIDQRFKNIKLTTFDLNHKKINEHILKKEKTIIEKATIKNCINFEEHSVLFSLEERKKEVKLYVTEFDWKGFKETKEVFHIDYRRITNPNRISLGDDFFSNITSSENDKFIVFAYVTSRAEKKEKQKLQLVLFDNEMKQIWAKEHIFDKGDRYIRIRSISVDNQGRVYVLQKLKSQPATAFQKVKYDGFRITQISKDKARDISITTDDEYFINEAPMVSFKKGAENVLQVYGVFDDSEGFAKGIYYQEYSSEGMLLKNTQLTLGEKELVGFDKQKKLSKNNRKSLFNISEIQSFDDGSMVFLLSAGYLDFFASNGVVIAHHGNALLIKLSPEGKHIFTKKINRYYAKTLNLLYKTNFAFDLYEDKIYLLYQNEKDEKNEILMEIIDEKGEQVYKKSIMHLKRPIHNYMFLAPKSIHLGDKLLIFAGDNIRDGEYSFGTINLN